MGTEGGRGETICGGEAIGMQGTLGMGEEDVGVKHMGCIRLWAWGQGNCGV